MKFFSKNKAEDEFIMEIERDTLPKAEPKPKPKTAEPKPKTVQQIAVEPKPKQVNKTVNLSEPKVAPAHKLTVAEVLGSKPETAAKYDGKSALESLRNRMLYNDFSNTADQIPEQKPTVLNTKKAETASDDKKSLLEKCKPFITDNDGKDASQSSAPLYKLQSVAEILEDNRQKSIDRLAEQYSITVDDLGKNKKEPEKEPFVKQEPVPTADREIIEINAFFENVQSSVPFSVSEVETETVPEETENLQDGSTITFTPLNDEPSEKPKIVVTSNTQNIDLTGEIAPVSDYENTQTQQIELEKSEFEDFVPQEEIKNAQDTKKYIRKFSIAKRRRFLVAVFTFLCTAILGFMKLPFMSGASLGNTMPTMIFCTSVAFLTVLFGCDMFLSLKTVFSKKATSDTCPALAAVFVLGYAITGIIAGEIVLDMLLLLSVILSIRALSKFRKESYMLSNLRQISKQGTKNAVKLIDDKTVTFAMAKNSIDGDALIAASQQCSTVSDFIKYSSFGTFLNGKMPIITILSLIVAVFSAIAGAGYYDGALYGLYAAASVLCFASLPTVFFINDFPLYSAAKKLNKKGCAILGQAGASHIEMANAVMLNSKDIFPDKTVTLYQMKVLSENNLDKTILRAASLTECLNSPLSHIFKTIAGESNITTLPDSDTIKYEERMGISGWVDDELLFIGNRTLMQAHGIAVPDIEIDKKILRSGYFPVYVASTDKACALLVVKYSVDSDVATELRNLTKIGVTLLVNNTDPNINQEMICDYLGLYDDSVMIMTNAGYHMYKNHTLPKEKLSAPAVFRFGNISIPRIVNCANKIKRSNTLLTVLYIISAILGIIIFAYSSFAGSGTIIGSTTVLLYSLICTAVSYILYFLQKP